MLSLTRRQTAGLLWVALSVLLATARERPFFFLQISDTQFGMWAENRDFLQETANFEFVVANANRLRPAFLVSCGDLVNQAGDVAQIAEYKRIAAKLDPHIQLYNVAGNHDVGNEPTPASIRAYREQFGPDYYTFRHAGMAGFVLNSGLIASPQKAPEEYARQKAWLETELAKAKKDGVGRLVIFQHHSWFLKDPGEPDQYFNIPLERRKPFLELFRRYGVSHVFAGHYHRTASGNDGPLEMVTTGPVSKPIGPDPSGIRVVIVRPGGIEHTYYGLGSIPNVVAP